MNTCYLLIGPEGLCAYSAGRRRPTRLAAFAPTPEGQQAFLEFIGGCRRSRFTILADVAGEERHIEHIPPLRGSDRHKLIDRRLALRFAGEALTCVESLGRAPEGRRDERLLLAALLRPALAAWLDALQSLGVAPSGVYSPGQLAPALLARLGEERRPTLLISVHERHLRESLVADGYCLFTRLVPLAGEPVTSLCAREIGAARRYIVAQRLVPQAENLSACILAPGELAGHLRGLLGEDPTLGVIDAGHLLRHNAEKRPDGKADDIACLWLELLARRRPGAGFSTPAQRQSGRIERWRQRLFAAGLAGLVAGGATGGGAWHTAQPLIHDTRQLHDETRRLQKQADNIDPPPGETGVPAQTLQQLVEQQASFERLPSDPLPLWQPISQALDAVPAIRLLSIETKFGPFFRSTGANPGPIARSTLRVAPEPPDGDPREMQAVAESFIVALRRTSSLQTEAALPPLPAAVPFGQARNVEPAPPVITVHITHGETKP